MHLGLIMDGNGRWAQQRSLPRSKGHEEGLEAAKRVLLSAAKHGVDYVTLYVFSTENWKRPKEEVNFLMKAMELMLPKEKPFFLENNIKVLHAGNLTSLPKGSRLAVEQIEKDTSQCSALTVILAINYGGQDEIVRAVNSFIKKNPARELTIDDICNNLDNPELPAPDMIARSAGEMRLSNFMLWNSAYAEFLSIEKLWPDWGEEEVLLCIEALSKRNRKYGGLTK